MRHVAASLPVAGDDTTRGGSTIRPMAGPELVIVLVVILVVVLMVRGPKTLPQLGEALGRAVSGARKAAREGDDGKPDRKSTRLNSSHIQKSRMPSSA